jgi:hypothetical protein
MNEKNQTDEGVCSGFESSTTFYLGEPQFGQFVMKAGNWTPHFLHFIIWYLWSCPAGAWAGAGAGW